MHPAETVNLFLELRAQGWTLPALAKRLEVSERTLVNWNRQYRAELHALRSSVLQDIQAKILPSYTQQMKRLAEQLNRFERGLLQTDISFANARDLHYIAAELRAEIRQLYHDLDAALEDDSAVLASIPAESAEIPEDAQPPHDS